MFRKQEIPVFCPEIEWTERELLSENYPSMTNWADAWKYVLRMVGGKCLPWMRPTEAQVQKIYDDLTGYAWEFCEDGIDVDDVIRTIDKTWPKVQGMLRENAGLIAYMNDIGSRSLGFYYFLLLVPRAIALESAFGNNYVNDGKYRSLRFDRVSSRSAVKEPIFTELRWRDYRSQSVVREALERYREAKEKYLNSGAWSGARAPEKPLVVSLGGGLLAEFRKFGFTLEDLRDLRIMACDMDESLIDELDVVFKHDFGIPFAESGIEYRICNIEDFFSKPELQNAADVVLMDGILSSYPKLKDMQRMVAGALRLLKKDGKFACDLQVMHPTLIRCALVLFWKSDMVPELSAKRALKKMRKVCANLQTHILRYEVDPRNKKPVGVHFVLAKSVA